MSQLALRLQQAIQQATHGLIERDHLAELLVLAAVAQEHLLVIGPPGTGKSAVVRRVAQALGGRYFEYLLGRFTEPSELFGPVNLNKLREGLVEVDTAGMLPEADIVFLDEVFLGSTAILNTLLGILNERKFRRGHTQLDCPLRLCVGAANALPEDEGLAAFADRFLLHTFVEPVPDAKLEDLLAGGWQVAQQPLSACAELSSLDTLQRAVPQVNMDVLRPDLAQAVRLLRQANIRLSDRRIVKAQRLIAAASVLAGRMTAQRSDLWPLLYAIPTAQGQQTAREVLQSLLAEARHPLLRAVVEESSQQPAARITRLQQQAQALLSAGAQADGAAGFAQQVQTLLREIDANFSSQAMPPELAELRSRLVSALGA